MSRTPGLLLATLAGIAMAAQARINGELGHRLHDGVAAAVISFGIGLVLVCVLTLALPSGRRGLGKVRLALHHGELRPWHLLGGAYGAFLVASQGLTVATLGVALFTVSVLTGQLISSLIVDRAGIGPGMAQPVTLRRLLGATITLLAVAITVADRIATPSGSALALLAGAAGFGIAWQQAVNGRVREAAEATLPPTLINFVVGMIALLIPWSVILIVRGLPAAFPTEPWLYLGGPLGTLFIAVAAAVVRTTGVLLLSLGTVTGQLGGAMLLDVVAPTTSAHLSPNTVLGLLVALCGVIVGATGRLTKTHA